MTRNFPAYLFVAALALAAACSKPSPFGSELLDDQLADYDFTDSLTLNFKVLREDSVLTSDRSSTADYFLCGQLNDPSFGVSQSDIYALLQLDNLDPGFEDTTDRLNSLELILRYDAPGVYGDTLQPLTLKVYRLDEQMRWDQDYYSNQKLGASEEIGSLDFTPQPNTALQNPFDTDTSATKYPYLRVPLSQAFGQYLLGLDSIHMNNDTTFWNLLKGIKITVSSASTPGAMLAFDLNNSVSRMRLSYTRYATADTTDLTFDYFFAGTNKFTHFEQQHGSSPAGQQIGQENPDLLYLQGMSGLKLKLEIPNADELEKIAINKAELVFTVADVPGDPGTLQPGDQLVLTEPRGDTAFSLISDVLFSLGPTFGSGFGAFGGYPEKENVNGTSLTRYRVTITQRFQDMVDDKSGDIKNKTLYLSVYPQRTSAMRSILYGPTNTAWPAKLEVKYTRIQ